MLSELAVFEKIITVESNKRENRSLDLLRDPTQECPKHWAVQLPSAFNIALDIERTDRVVKSESARSKEKVWTQGSAFAFSAGDIMYDTSNAYLEWFTALKSVGFMFEVVRAASAMPRQKDTPRYPGSVLLRVSKPNKDRTMMKEVGLVELTQDDLVHFVITGQNEELCRLVATVV